MEAASVFAVLEETLWGLNCTVHSIPFTVTFFVLTVFRALKLEAAMGQTDNWSFMNFEMFSISAKEVLEVCCLSWRIHFRSLG